MDYKTALEIIIKDISIKHNIDYDDLNNFMKQRNDEKVSIIYLEDYNNIVKNIKNVAIKYGSEYKIRKPNMSDFPEYICLSILNRVYNKKIRRTGSCKAGDLFH